MSLVELAPLIVASDRHGSVRAGRPITITDEDGGPVTVYSDRAGTTPLDPSAWLTDGSGQAPGYLGAGDYRVTIDGVPHFISVEGADGAVRSVLAREPLNKAKVRFTLPTLRRPDGYTDSESDLDVDLTTPQSHMALWSRHDDEDRDPGPSPLVYNWGIGVNEVQEGTKPVTCLFGTGRGHTINAIHGRARVYGVNPQAHALETTTGAFQSEATAVWTVGSNELTGIVVTEKGSRFEATMPLGGAIPVAPGTTIVSIEGRPGAPSKIIMSNPASASGAGAITADPVNQEVIGWLATANGVGSANSAAMQPQGQGVIGWGRIINIGASALRSDGTGIRFALAKAFRGLSFESNYFSDAAIYLPGQKLVDGVTDTPGKIKTDAVGFMLATTINERWAAHGRTPQPLQSVTGSRGGATVAVLQTLLTRLDAKGIVSDATTA